MMLLLLLLLTIVVVVHLSNHHQREGRDDQGCRCICAREVDAAQLPDAQVNLCFKGRMLLQHLSASCLGCAALYLALLALRFA